MGISTYLRKSWPRTGNNEMRNGQKALLYEDETGWQLQEPPDIYNALF